MLIMTLVLNIGLKSREPWLDHESVSNSSLWTYPFRGAFFRKELKLSDVIFMHTTISKMTADASRWTIIHELKIPKTKFVLRLR
jgi:hypothetical protein